MTGVKVPDACVIGAVAFGEEEAAAAARLLEGAELHAPSFLPYELANIARKKILKHPDKALALKAGLRLALSLDVRPVVVNQLEVVDLALARNISTYDAAYLWVALRLGAHLLTFDQRLKKASEGGG